MKVRAQALLFEAANPRHAHEWAVFAERKREIPDDKILVPGVIQSTSNYVEHPELVAERLVRFADIVGRERVMAGSDCGFSTFAGDALVDPEICFAKLAAMAEGAAIASQRLWRRPGSASP
jgi:5-methyltetrahydropteroyltriglutamate--homocysteine methyltransferase